MANKLFMQAVQRQNLDRPPVWMMRQAGRYHRHYQALRAQHSFIELCKNPQLAAEVTLGPIEDFDFDAAILFSDLLFPLEAMGMGLQYNEGPMLDWRFQKKEDVNKFNTHIDANATLGFQGDAIREIRKRLPADKALIGFVGAPLTLYYYAVEGSHQKAQVKTLDQDPSVDAFGMSARAGFGDGRFREFCVRVIELLVKNMAIQARAGADVVAIFDTCAGELNPTEYHEFAVSALAAVVDSFRREWPSVPVIYYSKGTGPDHWQALQGLSVQVLGVDWKHPLERVLLEWTPHFAVQGNSDPHWLHLAGSELEYRLREVFERVRQLPQNVRAAWICGLGHGVLPKTPEANVRLFLKLQREMFS